MDNLMHFIFHIKEMKTPCKNCGMEISGIYQFHSKFSQLKWL